MRWILLAACGVLGVAASPVHSPPPRAPEGEVYSGVWSAGVGFSVERGVVGGAVCVGSFAEAVNATGWAFLSVQPGGGGWNRSMEAHCMGFVEGWLTQGLMFDALLNFGASFYANGSLVPPAAVQRFVEQQMQWMREKTRENAGTCYWDTVGSVLDHVEGLIQGYLEKAPTKQKAPWQALYALTNAGDMEDLLRAVKGGDQGVVWEGMRQTPPTTLQQRTHTHHSCSGFVKWSQEGGEGDFFTGHTTFNGYAFALRVFRHATWRNAESCAVAESTLSYSARPGDLESKDDFYTVFSHKTQALTVIETSLSVFDTSIYSHVAPSSVPAWVRVLTANRISRSAAEWTDTFSLFNSGTHNNDWIVSDMRSVEEQGGLSPNCSRVLEQMPGLVESADLFPVLSSTSYFPSFNIPYFPKIFNYSGYNTTNFNWTTDPRANIFRRDQATVASLEDTAALMTQNNWQTDPLSLGNACNAISARCDLNPNSTEAFGGIDAKVVAAKNFTNLAQDFLGPPIRVQSSQTHATQPPFTFNDPRFQKVPHVGLPTTFDFPWLTTQAKRIQ